MANRDDHSDYSRDEEDAEILHGIELFLIKAGVKGIAGIGPIDDERASCTVLLSNQKDVALPSAVEIVTSNKRTIVLKLISAQDETPAVLLAGPNPKPWQYSGPLMGGDPIWNDAASQWGTITFAVDAASAVEIEGYSCANQCLTCDHVLDIVGANTASTTRYPNSMALKWNINPPSRNKWLDVAAAEMDAGVAFSPLEVRGLRHIKGVVQPRKGIRVSKYGAVTGLTSGRDLGWTKRQLSPTDPSLYWVRRVGGYFARVGDSGAPVLDADRNLVGLVVSGKPGVPNETYYIQALPKGQTPLPRVPPSAIPDLSCFVIDGI